MALRSSGTDAQFLRNMHFRDETRWMIEFSVKKPESTYGVPGDEMRLFLTEEDYRKALQSQHGSVKKFVSLEENDSFLVRITI